MRPPRREGARSDEPVRQDARLRAARSRRARRPDGSRRAHRRTLRDPAHERRRRSRQGVHDGRAHARGLLPHHVRDRGADRTRARVRAVCGRALVRDVHARSRRGSAVRRGRPRAVPRQAPRIQLLAVVQLAQAPGRQDDRVVPARARRHGLQVPVRDPRRLPRGLQLDVRSRPRLCDRWDERVRAAPGSRVRERGVRLHRHAPSARGRRRLLRRGARSRHGRRELDPRAQGLDRGGPVRGGAAVA